MSINQVCISGNLTRDAETRNSGKAAIVHFSVAVNERRKNPTSGEWEDYANYIDCVAFGNYADTIAPSMTKGTRVCVSGKLRWSAWEKDGQKRTKVEVIANDIELPPRSKAQSVYADDCPF